MTNLFVTRWCDGCDHGAVTGLRVLLDDRMLVESPRWHDDRLLFSDWGAGEIVAVDLNGRAEVVAHVASMPFCIDRLPDGRLIVVSSSQLLRRETDGDLVVHADLSELSTKPWNDIVVDGRGNIYVNNIGFDFPGGEFAPGWSPWSHPTVRCGRSPTGSPSPTGWPCRRTIGRWWSPSRTRASSPDTRSRPMGAWPAGRRGPRLGENAAPDGICLDAENAAWYASVPGRHCVRVAKAARSSRPSRPTAGASPACSAAQTVAPCSSSARNGRTRWRGTDEPGRSGPPR